MQVEYTLGESDWAAFYLYDLARKARRRGKIARTIDEALRIGVVLFVGAVAALLVLVQVLFLVAEPQSFNLLLTLLLLLLLVVIGAGFVWLATPRNLARAARNYARDRIRAYARQGMYERPRVSASVAADGLVEVDELHQKKGRVTIQWRSRCLVPWTEVRRIDVTNTHAFFEIAGLDDLILPRAAFATDQDFLAFMDLAERYHWDAREGRRKKVSSDEVGVTARPSGPPGTGGDSNQICVPPPR